MRYFWCWLCPPFGLLTCDKPGQAIINFMLCCTIIGIPFAVVWSLLVARDYYADSRNQQLIQAIHGVRDAMPVPSFRAKRAGRAGPEDDAELESHSDEELSEGTSVRQWSVWAVAGVASIFIGGSITLMVVFSFQKPHATQPIVAASDPNPPITPAPKSPPPKTTPAIVPAKPKPSGEGEKLATSDLLDRFESSRPEASRRYNGANVTITGKLSSPPDEYPDGEIVVRLLGSRDGGPYVWCRMTPGPDVVASRFPPGAEVTVRGRCLGTGAVRGPVGSPPAKDNEVVLAECALVGEAVSPIPEGTDYPKAVTRNDIEVRIVSVQVGHPTIVLAGGANAGATTRIKEKCLICRLQVRNAKLPDSDKASVYTYTHPTESEVRLVDERGNTFDYARFAVELDPDTLVARELAADPKLPRRFQDESASTVLEPGQTGTYFLVFSPEKLGKGNRLFLTLSSGMFGTPKPPAQVFRFSQSLVTNLPEPSVGPPDPKPAPASDPALDAKLVALTTQLAKGKLPADRIKAADELLKLGSKAKSATPALCQAILDSSPQVRVTALDAMKAVNPDVHGPVATLAAPFTEADFLLMESSGRPEAVAALAKLGKEGRPAVPVLIAYKRSLSRPGGWPYAASVVDALASLAPDDPAVVTVLVTGLLKDGYAEARFSAANGLAATKPTKESVAALATSMRGDPEPEVRLASVKALGVMGTDAKGALKSLEAAKTDPDPRVREAARDAIEKVK